MGTVRQGNGPGSSGQLLHRDDVRQVAHLASTVLARSCDAKEAHVTLANNIQHYIITGAV